MKLALDIGGTYFRWEIIGVAKGKEPTQKIDIQDFLSQLIERYKVRALGISFAGQVHRSRILSAPNVHTSFDPASFGIPYIIENDLNCAVLAEARYWQSTHIAALYSGTGLGSGIIDEGRLVRGFRNLAGEIGHIPYRQAPFRCGCGKDNCIELYASGGGIHKWARYLGVEAVLKEPKIKKLYLEALATAAATIFTLCNPKFLILGGGVVQANPDVLQWLKENLSRYAPSFALEGCEIRQSELSDASLEGAKILLERLI